MAVRADAKPLQLSVGNCAWAKTLPGSINRSSMCTSLFLWDQHPTLLLLLAFNRDEFLDRYTRSTLRLAFSQAIDKLVVGKRSQLISGQTGRASWLAEMPKEGGHGLE